MMGLLWAPANHSESWRAHGGGWVVLGAQRDRQSCVHVAPELPLTQKRSLQIQTGHGKIPSARSKQNRQDAKQDDNEDRHGSLARENSQLVETGGDRAFCRILACSSAQIGQFCSTVSMWTIDG